MQFCLSGAEQGCFAPSDAASTTPHAEQDAWQQDPGDPRRAESGFVTGGEGEQDLRPGERVPAPPSGPQPYTAPHRHRTKPITLELHPEDEPDVASGFVSTSRVLHSAH